MIRGRRTPEEDAPERPSSSSAAAACALALALALDDATPSDGPPPMDPSAPPRSGPGYLVRRAADAPTVPCPCGQSTRLLTFEDAPPANFHITSITDSARHYHARCTELYYILEGTGELELNDDVVAVEPGMLIVIEPYTRHRLRSPGGVRTIVLGVPAWHPDDEYFD